jgi:hypothetical protein
VFKITKKKVAAGVLAAGIVASSGLAYAYWTSSGNGVGEATAGDAAAWDVTTDAADGDPLSPDGPTQTITINVENDGSGTQRLEQLDIKIADANGDPWNDGLCTAADFEVGGEDAGDPHSITGIDEDITSGATNSLHSVTVHMVDTGSNQDDCKLVDVPLYVEAS